jgi:hypothetical protein
MIELTDQQRQQLNTGNAVALTDPHTSQSYVILRKDIYDRIQHLLFDDSDWTEEELRLQLGRSAQDNGWNEPGMEAYDRYDEELQKLRQRCP